MTSISRRNRLDQIVGTHQVGVACVGRSATRDDTPADASAPGAGCRHHPGAGLGARRVVGSAQAGSAGQQGQDHGAQMTLQRVPAVLATRTAALGPIPANGATNWRRRWRVGGCFAAWKIDGSRTATARLPASTAALRTPIQHRCCRWLLSQGRTGAQAQSQSRTAITLAARPDT